jgi:hypothetical protein
MNVQGSCHCGAIRFRGLVDPASVAICHCTDCQKLTGTAYRVSVPARRTDFELQQGEPAVYIKVGDSGAKRAQAFCGTCGSPLYTYTYSEGDQQPQTYGLRVGSLDERLLLAPQKQKWCDSALPWALDISALPRVGREI